jgi:hypothetical protein
MVFLYFECLFYDKFRARKACVFFAQHSLENRPNALWEQPFFIAPQVCSANVQGATEGASPCRAFLAGDLITLMCKPAKNAGEQGEVPTVLSHWTDTEPSHNKQCFGGSR